MRVAPPGRGLVQIGMPVRFDLDHAGIAVRSLDDAEARYRRLGFTLTERSFHVRPRDGDGALVPSGTGNHCIMLQQGYIELLAVTDPNYDGSLLGDLGRYEGLHLLAFGTPSAEEAQSQLARAVGHVGPVGAVRPLARPIRERGVSATAAFKLIDLPPGLFREGFFFAMQHLTREVLWQPHLVAHANGATRLLGAIVCTDDPGDFLDRLAATFALTRWGDVVRLAAGEIEAVTPEALARRFPGITAPTLPFLAGVRLGTESLEATRHHLESQGALFHADRGRIWIAPGAACGAVLEFAANPR